MLTELTETLWLHRHYTFTLAELSELSGLDELALRDMVDVGILEPMEPEAMPWSFGADRLLTVRMACRLSKDFDLDPQGLALAVSLLERIHALEAEVLELRAKLPRVFP
jgi:chaperone modulatory protein CbpM